MLEFRNISVQYDGRTVLRDISFELKPGEIVALLGANGAGKSTLIRALNGTVPIAAGEIALDGRRLGDMSRREIAKNIAVIAQENETRFPVTILEFVLVGRFVHGGAFGWESEDDIAFADDALEKCDLGAYRDQLMNHLSGGERQRVLLARALAVQARLLLLDEPTANLDLAHQAMMLRLVRERCEAADASAVLITHDLNLASEFADEVILLKDGDILAKGKPQGILNAENLKKIYGVDVLLDENPVSKKVRITTVY